MSGNSIGTNLIVTCFGESHGKCIGVVIDGCPPGLELTIEEIQKEVDKRKPEDPLFFTPRKEEDIVDIISGIFNGRTTGAPICTIVWNKQMDSRPYHDIRWTPRPGHADYPAWIRYKGFNDYRGGGRFTGRITVAYVMAGTIAKKLLSQHGVEVVAHATQIDQITLKKKPTRKEIRETVYLNPMRCADLKVAKLMEEAVAKAREKNDSVGGIIETIAFNMPPGIGEPIFNSLDADLAKALFDIPSVKGVEFGEGFNVANLQGSQNNDAYIVKDGKVLTLSNKAGGVLGGMSTGMPIVVRVAFKPTPSIAKPQRTVNIRTMIETKIEVKGKHDACIVPRAVPVVESIMAIILADHLLGSLN